LSAHDLTPVWNGSSGLFTKTFSSPYRSAGLSTGPVTSSVHRSLDHMTVRAFGQPGI
jgi:hypothetical protein